MGRPRSTAPTEAEFEILQILWQRRVATVRDVQDDLIKARKIAYTSIATIMRIMVAKGMVEVSDARRPQRFRPVISENEARKQITDTWLSRQFGGSISQLFHYVLAGRRLSAAEVRELKTLVESSGSRSRTTASTSA